MSAWPGKYVIGLTGNIATGKSVVRKMLEHLGAYGIDADALAHRAIAQGAPGYQLVVEMFGKWVLAADGQIDRNKLGRIVFNDPEALAQLEAIIHPLVVQAVDILVRRSQQKIIVIEAIKLIEAGLHNRCDALWVTTTPQEVQQTRLVQKRGMSEAVARQRIQAQPSQAEKLAIATVAVRTDCTFEDTWKQVNLAWQKAFPTVEPEPTTPQPAAKGEMLVQRARPRQAADIAALMTRLSSGRRRLTREDVMAAFGEKAFLILKIGAQSVGVVGWKVENLVARTDDVYLESNVDFAQAMNVLIGEVERTSRELQCEASLLFLSPELARMESTFINLGYQVRTIQNLGVRAWQEAAQESMPSGTMMMFKQLRQDRVLRPV